MHEGKKPRDHALGLLNGLFNGSEVSPNYLDDLFRNATYLDGRDKAFISHLVQGVARWKLRLDWIIKQHAKHPLQQIEPPILNILRLAVYQIYFLDRVPDSAAVNEAVKQAKILKKKRFISSFVNGILRNICRRKDPIAFPDREKDRVSYLSVYYSFPQWLVRKWIRELGVAVTEELLPALNRLPDLNIRVNTIKTNRARLMESLRDEGISGKPTAVAPHGLIIEDLKTRVNRLRPFREGLFLVQDQAAQLTSHLLAPQPGQRVLDVCAGLGGKATHMAEIMKGKGLIIALDISRKRLIHLDRTSKRLGIHSIHPLVGDAAGSLNSLFRCRFHRIMVDAPCSGLGVISRHPDGKWNRDEAAISRLAQLQKTIMREAAALLDRGGRMLYVTCTISKEENEEVVEDLLECAGDMYLENLKEHAPAWGKDLIDDQGFYRTYPHIHGMDGFFAALLKKKP